MSRWKAGRCRRRDFRGKQSAALKVVGTSLCTLDLRVDEHRTPVAELRRILSIARRQLMPFVQAMPRREQPRRAMPPTVTQMLLKHRASAA